MMTWRLCQTRWNSAASTKFRISRSCPGDSDAVEVYLSIWEANKFFTHTHEQDLVLQLIEIWNKLPIVDNFGINIVLLVISSILGS
jgi:hypothetical protein